MGIEILYHACTTEFNNVLSERLGGDRSHFMAACTEFPELEELVMEVAFRLPDPSSLYSRPSESCCLLSPAQEVLEQCICACTGSLVGAIWQHLGQGTKMLAR